MGAFLWRKDEMIYYKKKEVPEVKKVVVEKPVEVKVVKVETKSQTSTDVHWIKPTPPIVRDNPNDH